MAKRRKKKAGLPKKRGRREPKSLGVLTVKRGRGRRVGDSRASSRSHNVFKTPKATGSAEKRPSLLPDGPIKIKSKLIAD
jgi:hypothetical protein